MITLTFPAGAALVAGGTGSVGRGVVTQLAAAGLPVTFTYRGSEDAARRLAAALTADGGRVQAVRMDAGDVDSIGAAIAAAEELGGPLATVAWAVGATVPFNTIADFTVEEVAAFVEGDTMACYRFLHEVVPVLRRNGGGSVTAATTIATHRVLAYDGISPFSKGAVQALLRQLAAEEAAHGIRCNDVAVGMVFDLPVADVRTAMEGVEGVDAERLRALLDQLHDLARLGSAQPVDAGNLFAFLASDQAAMITGQRIALDGGMTL